MKTLRILVGPPGSGKSTFAQDMIENDGDIGAMVTRISQDDQGRKGHMDLFEKAIANGEHIILDRMNFSKEQRNRYLIPAKKAGYHTEIIVFHVPYATCLERCMQRKDHPTINNVGQKEYDFSGALQKEKAQSALHTFFTKYERVSDLEADSVKRLGWDNQSKEKIIWCDLDNTLCNTDHRNHFVNRSQGKPDWKGFFDAMGEDLCNEWCKQILLNFHQNGTKIFLASGRPDNYRKVTESWLTHYQIPYEDLFMRQRNDFRQDDIVKEIILEFEVKPRADILFALDDRDQVVRKLRERGVIVLQCDYGNF